jgi:hypothetical protein
MGLNVRNLKKLRAHLTRTPPEKFDLSVWFRDPVLDRSNEALRVAGVTCGTTREGSCGTVACIAGHTLALFQPDAPIPGPIDTLLKATDYLGLTSQQANELFTPRDPDPYGLHPSEYRKTITLPQAIATIERLIETGEVSWT